jgi:hypothetical protein
MRRVRSWFVPVVVGAPLGMFLAAAIYGVDPALLRAFWIAAPVAPWFLIMLLDRWALFAIAIWLLPAAATMVLVSRLPVGVGWVFLSGAVLLSGAALCMSEPVRGAYGQFVGRIANWLIEGTLSSRKRAAFRLLLRMPSGSASDLGRAHRELAFANRQMEAPDDRWREALLASAAFHDLGADMLEGKRPVDQDDLKAAAGSRDRLTIAVLRAQSPVYRIVNYSPIRP